MKMRPWVGDTHECSSCGRAKPWDQFVANRAALPHGRQQPCKSCAATKARIANRSGRWRRRRTGDQLLPKADLAQRFWAKVDRSGSCWTWTAYRARRPDGSLGYGKFNFGARHEYAHRVAWELTNGPIPPGRCVLHVCDNPPCVNPAHLSLGTQADNIHDCMAKGRKKPPPPKRAKTITSGCVAPASVAVVHAAGNAR